MPEDLLGLDREAARAWAAARGLPAFRGEQLHQAVFSAGASAWSEICAWPQQLRETLAAEQPLLPVLEVQRQESRDGTVKSLLRLHDEHLLECVSIPTATRHTICVSSQVGCAVGCTFCASGLDGVKRDCTAGEIVAQVLHHHRQRAVSNVVYMGSGEPLFNYRAVRQSIAVLADPTGLGLGKRRFTVSTSGVPGKIEQLAQDEPQVTLALSLHAPDDDTRSRLVPLNRRWPIETLMQAMDQYRARVGRRITLEYVLLADANMSPQQAELLGGLARRYGAHINLIPFNPVTATPHRRPSQAEVLAFAAAVQAAGGHVTVRGQRGADIDAACGQLVRRSGGERR